KKGEKLEDENAALHAADELRHLIGLEFLNNSELRSAETGNAASIVSAFGPVRQALFNLQRNFALEPPGGAAGAILDGRDIGTVICPDADIKFFVTARAEIRAQRRARELYGEAWEEYYEDMLQKTNERDKRDSERATAPLKAAKDAILLDTSALGPDETLAVALDQIRKNRPIAPG
ncbi:MAG: hypothetical protein JWM96_510, partial [Alphaproteobacteria bacterium]|nr:hypothetical protein [Alphaproteobacteria bacterium]